MKVSLELKSQEGKTVRLVEIWVKSEEAVHGPIGVGVPGRLKGSQGGPVWREHRGHTP